MSSGSDATMTLSNGKNGAEPGVAAGTAEEVADEGTAERFPEVSLLPLVHGILHAIEKDAQDANAKNRDSLEASQKVLELGRKVESARNHAYKMPGVQYSKEVQRRRLENLRKQLEMKKNLIRKYKQLDLKLTGQNDAGAAAKTGAPA